MITFFFDKKLPRYKNTSKVCKLKMKSSKIKFILVPTVLTFESKKNESVLTGFRKNCPLLRTNIKKEEGKILPLCFFAYLYYL